MPRQCLCFVDKGVVIVSYVLEAQTMPQAEGKIEVAWWKEIYSHRKKEGHILMDECYSAQSEAIIGLVCGPA